MEFIHGPGYVLHFSDSTFAEFFADELGIDIDDPVYAKHGGSKGKRLRCLLQQTDDATAIRVLRALWEHRAEYLQRTGQADPVPNAEERFCSIVSRMGSATTIGHSEPSSAKTMNVPRPNTTRTTIDITKHQFDVALSFPGESRNLVEEVASALDAEMGPHRCFYDSYYKAQLARPALDVLLQDIYRNRSRLVVVFIGSDYQRKDWCGIEFRAIREIVLRRGYEHIMFVRLDDGEVDGVFRTDGYIDARTHSASEIATLIQERVTLLKLDLD